MALSRYGNDRPFGRNGNICIFDRARVVGFGRPPGRAAFHARFSRGAFDFARAFGAASGAASAGDVERPGVRLAATRKSIHDDARDQDAETRGAPRFAAPVARVVEIAAWLGAA